MADQLGALSRRRLLGAGAVVGATALAATARPAAAGTRLDQPLTTASGAESRFYAGITLMAGNELATPTSTVFVKDPFNGSYPSTVNGYVGTALDVPAGSVVHEIVFFLYQQAGGGQQLCAVQLYHPGTTGYEVILSHVATEAGIVAVSTAGAAPGTLPRLVGAGDALCAFVWRGQQSAVCRGIRVDYTAPGGGIGGTAGGGPGRRRAGAGLRLPPERRQARRRRAARRVAGDGSSTGETVVPVGATAAAITLTVTGTEGAGGYVAVFPAGGTWSGTSSVNWFGPGQNLATTAIVALGANLDVVLLGGANPTDVIVDVTAYVS